MSQRQSVRDLGLAPGSLPPGPLNAITDVPGVRVGQVTLRRGSGIRTGVTAIVPDAVNRAGGTLPAGLFVGNGFGKLIGATQLVELGAIETPIVLTGTLSAFRAADALVTYLLALPGNEGLVTVNPVVGETNDGYLSDIRARPVSEDDVLAALRGAVTGPVEQGAVGAGTGTTALGFKAGIGTASRQVRLPGGAPCTVGALVQANFAGTLTVVGTRITPDVALPGASDPRAAEPRAAKPRVGGPGAFEPGAGEVPAAPVEPGTEPNSCMIIVAVDACLDSRQLTRVARRAVFAMARTGSDFTAGSGDYAIAFATRAGAPVPENYLGTVFAAAMEAVEEAILNSLFLAETTTGFLGHVRHAVPLGYLVRACQAAVPSADRRPGIGS
ncbi:MAG: P1 family peptidase [Streptosporangiaceae bacterium]